MSKYADFIISCIHRDLLSLFHRNLIFTAMYTFWHECTFKMCAFIKKMCLNKCLWHIYDYMNYIVAFWKIYLATSITGVFGAWSNQNCSVSETQKYDGFITCECNHLTNFALLLDVSQSRNDPLALSIVTWIGCGISMLGLVLTIITFLYFKLVYFIPYFVISIFRIANFF